MDLAGDPCPVIRVRLKVIGETKYAWRVHDGFHTDWLPKSQTTINDDGTIMLPLWIAKDRGF
jgi:hypothetical protein